MQQARGHATGKGLALAGDQRQPCPQRIAGGGVGVTGHSIQEQVGEAVPRQMGREIARLRENEPSRINATAVLLPLSILTE